MKRIIIIRASKGIGKELTIEFAKKGHQLVLLSRNEELL